MILAGYFGSSFYTTYCKGLLRRFQEIEILVFSYITASLASIPLLIWAEPFHWTVFGTFDWKSWAAFAFLAILMDRASMLFFFAAATSGAAPLGSASSLTSGATLHEFQTGPEISLPAPQDSGIEHVVVLMMENRSFDHFLGWFPGADGKQAGLQYANNKRVTHATHGLAPDFRGCPHADPDHSYNGGRTEYDGGKMDGFLRAGSDDVYSIGYYVEEDLPFYSALARNYTAMDRYFCSILAPTFPNRLFLHAANTDRLTNSVDLTSLPTICDRLAENGVGRKYYFSNVPILAFWGLKYLEISVFYEQFLDDAARGTLPAVSFVDPKYTLLDLDTANDDHPPSNVKQRVGQ